MRSREKERKDRESESEKKDRVSLRRERIKNIKKIITSCYSALSKMRAHCSKMSNFLAYDIFDGVDFYGFSIYTTLIRMLLVDNYSFQVSSVVVGQ